MSQNRVNPWQKFLTDKLVIVRGLSFMIKNVSDNGVYTTLIRVIPQEIIFVQINWTLCRYLFVRRDRCAIQWVIYGLKQGNPLENTLGQINWSLLGNSFLRGDRWVFQRSSYFLKQDIFLELLFWTIYVQQYNEKIWNNKLIFSTSFTNRIINKSLWNFFF